MIGVEDRLHLGAFRHMSWAAVWSGVAFTLVTQVVLNLLGMGLGGAGAVTASGEYVASTGTMLWWAVSCILGACAGGYAAGRLSGTVHESTAGWHGLTAWAVSVLLFTVIMAGTLMVVGSIAAAHVTAAGTAVAPPAVPSGTAHAMAVSGPRNALIGAAALILSAIAAWYCGCAGANDHPLADEINRRQQLH
jgi:hypothetical protein